MTSFGPALDGLLAAWGPGALFVLAVLETSFVTGLVVPSGTVAAFVAAVAGADPGAVAVILGAIVAGGWVGDALGYAIGRWWGQRLLADPGWVGRAVRKHQATGVRYLGRHPFYSVTVARWVSFVRTVMPMSAGIAGVGPGTFFAYELPGVLGWAFLYVGIGVLAGESWQLVSSLVGGGWLLVFTVAGIILWKRSRMARKKAGPETGGEAG